MEVIMLKKITLLGMIISATSAFGVIKVVAWDIHQVLCTKPTGLGYQCVPKEDTFALVKELHEKGVKQVILSNISSRSFSILSNNYPNHFNYFDSNGSLANAHFMFTRKPHGKYYSQFLKRNTAIAPNECIFFDDKPENIKGARAFGIDGQIFRNAKQARIILQRKGLL